MGKSSAFLKADEETLKKLRHIVKGGIHSDMIEDANAGEDDVLTANKLNIKGNQKSFRE